MTGTGQFKERNTPRAKELRNSATPAERLLWQYLARSQLGLKFSRQMPIGPFFADFLCRQQMLVIELDGHSHDINPGRDIWRDRYLVEHGYRVLHFQNAEVFGNVEGVIMAIRSALIEGPTPSPSRKREGSQ